MRDKRAYYRNRYCRLRAEYIEILGGFCVDCGSDQQLEFDHIESQEKMFVITRFITRRRDFVLKELEKCVLRCKDCHRIRTDAMFSVVHGGGKSGKKNCKCVPCKAKKAEYMKAFKKKNKGS